MIFKDAKGFSLVEMMVVVATISLLAAVGIPQYSKFKRKAHETEAKVSLGAIYVTEKSFHGEYSFYHTSLQAIGFGLEGRHYFNVGFGTTTAVVPAAYGFNAVVDDTIMDIRSLCVGYNGTGSDVSCQLMVDIPDIPTVSTATADDFFAAAVSTPALYAKNEVQPGVMSLVVEALVLPIDVMARPPPTEQTMPIDCRNPIYAAYCTSPSSYYEDTSKSMWTIDSTKTIKATPCMVLDRSGT